jgi:hypothetical protein
VHSGHGKGGPVITAKRPLRHVAVHPDRHLYRNPGQRDCNRLAAPGARP